MGNDIAIHFQSITIHKCSSNKTSADIQQRRLKAPAPPLSIQLQLGEAVLALPVLDAKRHWLERQVLDAEVACRLLQELSKGMRVCVRERVSDGE